MNPLESALEAIERIETDDVSFHTAAALLRGYHDRWATQAWVAVAVEQEFHLPLVNPETTRASRTFTWGGKRDAIATYDGRRYVVEHKTTSDDISDPNSDYWRQLNIDSQVSAYALAAWQEGNKVDGTLYDVLRKPTIRPKQIEKKSVAEIASLGTYCKLKVSPETQRNVINGMDRENGELFGLRLGADIAENPAKYFQRRVLTRLDHELAEFANELWQIAQEIRESNNRETHFKNSGACMLYGRACEYLGICSGHDTPESDRWAKADNPHRELETVPKTALTNSRIRCYATCRRKHHYRYNLGLVRPATEDAEALRFGHLVHVGLEAWWKCFVPLENCNGNGNIEHAASGVACSEAAQA